MINCSPNNLSQASSCIRCLSDASLVTARTYLLCAWANAAGAGGNFTMAAPTPFQWTWTDTGGGTVTATLVAGCVSGADGFQLGACASPCNPQSNIIGTSACNASQVATLALGQTALGQIRWTFGGVPVSAWSTIKSVALVQDPLVTDWLNRISLVAGTAPSQNQINAHDIFAKGLRSTTFFAKIKSANAFVNSGILAARTPFIKFTTDANTWTTDTYTLDAAVTKDGLLGDGVGRLFTTMTPAALFSSDGNCGGSVYCFTTNNNAEFELGIFEDGVNCFQISTNYTDVKIRVDAWENSDFNGETQVASPNVGGFTSYSKVAANDSRVYFANSTTPFGQQGATNANVTGGTRGATKGIVVMTTATSAFVAIQPTTKRVSFVAFHDGLTFSETQSFYNLVQALRVNLGGGFK